MRGGDAAAGADRDRAEEGVADALTLGDYERLARQRMDPAVWDFVAGGSGDERSLTANAAAFDRVRLLPRVFAGVQEPDPATTVLGRRWAAPIGVAPMAYHTLAHPDGEAATAAAAGAAGLPLVVSTFSGRTFEDVAAVSAAPLWLQTYVFRDRAVTRDLVVRARQAGFEALVVTADVPRLGRRVRDLRNGFRLPPGIVPANLPAADYSSPAGHARTELDPGLDWSVIGWLRETAGLPVLVKGVLTAADAVRAVEAGVDGIVVSNHGGRQLDGVPAAFEVLPAIADAVAGRCALLLDGGVRRGADVLAAVACGADAVLVGRPVLHGLAVAGRQGAAGVLGLLHEEFCDAMALIGAGAAPDLDRGMVEAAGSVLAPPSHVRPGAPQFTTSGRDAASGAVPARASSAEQPAAGGAVRPEASSTVQPRASGVVRPEASGVVLKERLHASLADPVLDTMNFLNEITARYPDAVSFAPGRPYEEFFATGDVSAHLQRYLDHLADAGASPQDVRTFVYQYGATAGRIRDVVAQSLLVDEGIDVPVESIVVTVGCQEAMLITLRALFRDPQDVLLVSTPAYVGVTGAARLLDITVAGVEEDPVEGLSCAAVEAAALHEIAQGRRPRALYLVPDHSNPSGNTVGTATRRALLDLAARLDFLILEDSPYRGVSPGERLPTLKALDRERRVVHLGSYSKTVFPGARVGFAVADQTVVDAQGRTGLLADELAKVKSMVTVNTSSLSQAVVAGMLLAADGGLAKANQRAAEHYGRARDLLLTCLERHFPAADRAAHRVAWNSPTGGFFLGVRVPFAADEQALTRSAEEFGVIWTPMAYFHPGAGDGGRTTMRLSFSCLTPEEIETGAARLAAFVTAESARGGVPGLTLPQ